MTGDMAPGRRPERERAFLMLITGVEGELLGKIQHRVWSREATQQIVQETYLRAWRDPKFDPERPNARAWLFKTARWLARDWRESLENSSMSLPPEMELEDRNASNVWKRLIEEERNRHLYAALALLKKESREVLERYYLREEGTEFEIANSMGISVACFNTRLNRARTELKGVIERLRGRDRGDGAVL